MSDTLENSRLPYRVRHESKLRNLTVQSVTQLSPTMLRIGFIGDDLIDFVSVGFDDHIKVFLPDPKMGESPKLDLSNENVKFEREIKLIARDYTPRFFSQENKSLSIDFAIHQAGPATEWAQQAKVGDSLKIGGPRGSMVIPMLYEHYYFIGDETALPAIARRLEELPSSAGATVLLEVDSENNEIVLNTNAQVDVQWLHRNGAAQGTLALFEKAVNELEISQPNDAFVWIATEASVARELRKIFMSKFNFDKTLVKAAGYWKHGESNIHSVIQED